MKKVHHALAHAIRSTLLGSDGLFWNRVS
jgi:hypothetical protein